MYHEKQISNYCRCHAINNLFGKQLISLKEFDQYCDDFDRKNHFSVGCSKSHHMFNNYGGTNNIFGYVLERKNIKCTMKHYDFYSNQKNIQKHDNLIGYIVYNTRHTWCIKFVKNIFYCIDSMKRNIIQLQNIETCNRKQLGVIEIYY